jgi:hypothetical protein
MSEAYEEYQIEWRGQEITVRWCSAWMSGVTAHLEIASNDSRAHPISETGYKSHFCPRELVDEAGGPGRLCDCVARDGR